MWLLFSLIASIVNALYYLSIQNAKISANVFMVYRGFLVVILMLPIILFFPVKFSLSFYLMSVLQGIIVAYTDYLSFKINKNYGAETVSSITPLTVAIVFVLWCFISPSIVLTYLDNPIKTFFIISSLFGVIWALLNYRKTPQTKEAFVSLIPVLFLSSIIAILNKLIMSYSGENPLLSACWRVFILSFIIGCVHICLYIKKKQPLKALIDVKTLCKGSILILLITALVCKSLAMLYTQNPAYVSCIVYLTSVWIMLFSYIFPFFELKKQNEQVHKKYEILFIVSIILLILATH